MKSQIIKWSKIILGIIVSGVIGNAMWELLKSYTGVFLVFVVKITTLGISTLNDNIYKEIAKGMHENMSLQLYVFLSAVILGFIISSILALFMMKKRISTTSSANSSNVIDREGFSIRFIKSKKSSYVLIVYIIFAGTLVMFDLARSVYINRAVTYYNQLITIINPDIDDQKEEVFNSIFAQIQNSKDYINLINEVEIFAKNKNYLIPIRPSLLI